eukprot:TRINITY_DN12285_c0_g2_i1.p1 TRINITY_DN12285_c0_g2~~TRINITY_DN12285_c0_g2_i1.p1  ORF type:complete len:123 (+),score=8.42 TRINITY_DN12285_c0_g2_i1:510-878(+)
MISLSILNVDATCNQPSHTLVTHSTKKESDQQTPSLLTTSPRNDKVLDPRLHPQIQNNKAMVRSRFWQSYLERRENYKTGLKFFQDFKSGQIKTHISKQGLSFPFTFNSRTSGENMAFQAMK